MQKFYPFFPIIQYSISLSDGGGAGFFGADTDAFVHRKDEDFAVANGPALDGRDYAMLSGNPRMTMVSY